MESNLTTPQIELQTKTDQSILERLKKKPRYGESLIQGFLFVCGAISILTTVGIVYELGKEALLFFQMPGVKVIDFLTTTVWQPTIGKFGVAPLLTATLVTTFMAMFVSLPLGLFAAIYLSEYATPRNRAILKPILEVLAGIPTVVYGFFALTTVSPLLRLIFGEQVQVYNTMSAGLVMGIMILPLMCSMSEDALNAVPRALREAAYGLGATRLETTVKVVVPAALSGIIAAFILSVSRAIGETMIVALAAGSGSNFTLNPFEAAETMTGYIARISGGDVSYDTADYNSIFAIGLMLFFITLTLNILSRRLVAQFREVYE